MVARTIRATLLACSAIGFAPALAQNNSAEPKDDEAIVVTAARTVLPASALPLTIDVIDARALAEQVSISGSVVDAVSTLSPSFSPTRQKLSGAGETLRGRSPLFAINGIPQSTPIRDGSRDGYTIDPFFIDRVELIYGSNALQGIGATGGVVNQVTIGPPRADGISGRALLQGSADTGFSDDGFGAKAAGLVGYRAGAFDATIGAAYEARGAFYDGHGRRIGVDGTQGEIQDSKSWSVFGRFGYAIGDSARLDLIANRFELKGDGDYVVVNGNRATGLPTTSRRGEAPGIPPANRVETLALSLIDDDLGGGALTSQVFFNRSRDTFGGSTAGTFQDPAIAPVGTLFDQSSNRSRKYGGKIAYERAVPGLEGLTGTLGFDALFDRTEQSLVLTDRVWVPPTDFRSLAPFAQFNLGLLDNKLRLAGGARWENVELKVDDFTTLASSGSTFVSGGNPSFQDVLLNGGVIVEPMRGMRLYGSYAEGYTVPDVGRILRAVSTPGTDVDDFLDISPVVSNNRELGIELKRGPLDASVAYFWSSSKLGQFLVNNGGIFDVQRQRIEIEGIEINLTAQTPVPGLAFSVGYSHLVGQTDSNGDGDVDLDLDGANISPDRLNLAAIYRRGPLSARLQGQFHLSRRFDGGDPRNDFGGYAVADALVRYETGVGTLALSAQNLFDTHYISYNSDTTNPTDNSRFFAGRGRVFTLGWDYRF
ncbi:TonB-dependent receptor [Sphingomonas sp. LY54]|uniref:TonB-dependent receptor n=1 Tax=Sphingomonas sp. LY54 TaxID=3095343 RepID=UPI002D769BBD|nr:TonB-dependent receptor [Sphingomonas sp. LY54]WRP29888.1 TonB-dependent receptor [Sphingomonas sp. LY54]